MQAKEAKAARKRKDRKETMHAELLNLTQMVDAGRLTYDFDNCDTILVKNVEKASSERIPWQAGVEGKRVSDSEGAIAKN